MRVELLDLSHLTEDLAPQYKRLSKTQIRLLSSQVPQSFLAKFKDEETALMELLDTVYGTLEDDDC